MARCTSTRDRNLRTLIAQGAARLIAEHGIPDWGLAKRKAARQLGLSERETMPSNDEIEQALRDYHTLFQAEEQAASLRAQRVDALRWMERLAEFQPALVGAVAEGWATQHSEIRLELTAEDPKAVERTLLNRGARFQPVATRPDHRDLGQLRVDTEAGMLRLVVLSPEQRRNLPRERQGERLRAADLRALLAAAGGDPPAARANP
jgi:hypothetical protein